MLYSDCREFQFPGTSKMCNLGNTRKEYRNLRGIRKLMSAMTVSAELHPMALRTGMAKVPTPVAIVKGVGGPDDNASMVVGSFVSVSLEPPLVGFFVGRESTSWPKIRQANEIGISVLSSNEESLCRLIFSKDKKRGNDLLWNENSIHTKESLVRMKFSVVDESDAGDHVFVLCRVNEIETSPEEAALPLIFHARDYKTVSSTKE